MSGQFGVCVLFPAPVRLRLRVKAVAVIILPLFRFHLYKMLQHLVSQFLVNLHLLILKFGHHLTNLIGIIAFTESQIAPALICLKEVTVSRSRLLPHPLQLHLLPHLVQYTPAGIQLLLKLFKYDDWHILFTVSSLFSLALGYF